MKVNYLIAYLLYLFITSQSVRFGLKKKYRYVMILVLIDRPEGELNNRPLLIFYSILARPTTFCFIVRGILACKLAITDNIQNIQECKQFSPKNIDINDVQSNLIIKWYMKDLHIDDQLSSQFGILVQIDEVVISDIQKYGFTNDYCIAIFDHLLNAHFISNWMKPNLHTVHQLRRISIAKEGSEYIFTLNRSKSQLQINLITSDVKYYNTLLFQDLPSNCRFIFDSNEELFNYLPSLSPSTLSVNRQQGKMAIRIRLDILGKQRMIDLPLKYQFKQAVIGIQYDAQSKLSIMFSEDKKSEKTIQNGKNFLPKQIFAKENLLSRESLLEEYGIQRKRIKLPQIQESISNQNVKIQIQTPKRQNAAILRQNTYLIQQAISSEIITRTQMPSLFSLNQFNHISLKIQPSIYNRYFWFSSQRIMLVFQFKDFHQVSSSIPFSILQKSYIGLRIMKSTKNNIYFGALVETRRKQKYTCQQQRALSLKLSGGRYLYEDGKQSGLTMPYLKKDQIIYLCIDPIGYQIVWFIEPKFIIRRSLPEVFRNQPLYPFVSMHDDGDQVEFI